MATRMLWADARIGEAIWGPNRHLSVAAKLNPHLVWLGHSAILTSLNFIRTSVMDLVGCTAFTVDKNSGKMLEHPRSSGGIAAATAPNQPEIRPHHPLSSFGSEAAYPQPDEAWARQLVDAYLENTQAFMELVSPADLNADVDAWYRHGQLKPLELCRIYVVLAIGCVLDRRSGQYEFDAADLFYRSSARILPISTDVSSHEAVAIWALRSVYMLSISRRNDAWDLIRTAIGLAIGAGMHTPRQTKEIVMHLESNVDDTATQTDFKALRCFISRCNIWKSLFVLDSFLSALVGRPNAVPDLSCSEEGWDVMTDDERRLAGTLHRASGLDEAVQTSRTILMALKRVYDPNSTCLKTHSVREVADDSRTRRRAREQPPRWGDKLDHGDDDHYDHDHHHRNHHHHLAPTPPASPACSTTRLHLDLFYHHAIIVLTKPCFLWLYKWRCERLPRPDDLCDPVRLRQWATTHAKSEPGLSGVANGSIATAFGMPSCIWDDGLESSLRSDSSMLSPSSPAAAAATAFTTRSQHPTKSMMKKISAACVKASCMSMELLAAAFDSDQSFAPRNPFLM